MGDRIKKDQRPCQSISPKTNRPCLKPQNHDRRELTVVHRNGPITWGSGEEESNWIEVEPITWGSGEEPAATPFAKALHQMLREALPPVYGPALFAEDRFGIRYSTTHSSETDRKMDPITASEEHQLSEWWIQQAEDEIARTVPKAVEYGSTDLIDIGRNIARLAGRDVDDQRAAELGVFFYLEGKFARWRSAIMEGRDVSDDTMFDIGVYIRMAQRIREFGSWPGTTEPVEPHSILNNPVSGTATSTIPTQYPSPTLNCSCNECKDGHS